VLLSATIRGFTISRVLLRNPLEDGSYLFTTYVVGPRDADEDGIENRLDTCPYQPNYNWDPYSVNFTGDADHDGLPDDCDPSPSVPYDDDPDESLGESTAINDHDGDFFPNRGDNCPLVPNSISLFYAYGPDNQDDDDNDGIGNACDQNPHNADTEGAQPALCLLNFVQVGAGGTTSPEGLPCAICICDPIPQPAPTSSQTAAALPPSGGPPSDAAHSASARAVLALMAFLATIASLGAYRLRRP
jgi:hypothetical protein